MIARTAATAVLTGFALMLASHAASSPGPEMRETRAPNGLRIITKESFAKDLVALNVYVDGGNRTETTPLSGLSHYYEHLIFRGGTKKQAELETRKAFESLGEFGGWTSSDMTCYNFVVPAARFDEALERFVDAVMNVDVTAEKVAKEREVVLSEFKMSYADSPRGWSWYNLMRRAFTTHPYGRTTIGLREVIETADLARFKTFYAERYVPNHMVVAVVGAIPHDVAAEKVARAFAAFKPGKPSFETGEVEPAQEDFRAVVEAKKTEKSYGTLGFKAPAARAPDAYAVAVLAHVLGGGESSRLEREVRAKKGLVLDAGAWWDENKDPSVAGVSFSTEPGKEVAALGAIASELGRLKSEPVTDEELERAKTKITTDDLFANESYIQQANRLCWFALIGDPALGADHLDKIRAVTAADVREAARRYFVEKAATISLVVPESATSPTPTADVLAKALAAVEVGGDVASLPASERTLARKLESGDTVIAREDRSAPIIAVTVRFPDPLACEPAERPGTAALAERLLTRGAHVGTQELTREQFGARLDELGIRLSTGLDLDALTASLEVPAERFEEGLDLLQAAVLRPTFRKDEVEKARTEQIAAIQAVEDDSFALVGRESYASLFAGTIYGRPIEGTIEGVKAATEDELRTWHAQTVAPGRSVIAVVGAIRPERALAAIESRLGPAARAAAGKNSLVSHASIPNATLTSQAPPEKPAPRLLERKREQVCFRLAHAGIRATDPDWIPLAIALRHLGSQIFFRYVYENGMAYRAWTYMRSGLRAHPFTFEMGVSAPNFQKAREGLESSLRALVEQGLTPAEVEKAKKDLVARHILAQQTDAAQAALLAQYEAIGVGWRRLDELPALLAKATPDEVNAALRRHLHPDRLTLAVVGDLKAAGIAGGGTK